MNNLNHLTEVITTEAELTEQIVTVMKQQQDALVAANADAVTATVERQEELLLPIEGLEQERVRLTREIWSEIAPNKLIDDDALSLSALLGYVNSEDARRLSSAGARLQSAVKEVMTVNQANHYLIEHSRKFVRETFRIVTSGYSRKLVDQKI